MDIQKREERNRELLSEVVNEFMEPQFMACQEEYGIEERGKLADGRSVYYSSYREIWFTMAPDLEHFPRVTCQLLTAEEKSEFFFSL